MDNEEINQLTGYLQRFEIDPYAEELVQQETETVSFKYGDRSVSNYSPRFDPCV